MILTWKLWRGFKKPYPEHPLFMRVMGMPMKPMPWYMGCAIILVAPFLLLPAFVFMSAIYALRWAIMIASTIAQEREAGMYELVALSPHGTMGCNRAISAACLHRHESFEQIQSFGAWVIRLVFTLILMMAIQSVTPPIMISEANPNLNSFIAGLYLLTMAIAIYIDHVQSIVVGNLVGMLTPNYATNRLDAGFAALLVFLLLQVVTYLVTLLAGFVVLPNLLDGLGVPIQIGTIALAPLRVVIFYVVREWIIQVLWGALKSELNASASELDFMTG